MTAIHPPLQAGSVAFPYEHAHAEGHGHEELSFLKKYVFSTDHKVIGIQFLFVGLTFLAIGGLEAMAIRWQLAWPDGSHPLPILAKYLHWQGGRMSADFYAQAFSMHGSLMIFFAIIPLLVGVFGNYLIPLKIGAPDMAFPFLNGAAFWLAIPAGAVMTAGFFLPKGPGIAGWTSYPPLSQLWLNGGHVVVNSMPQDFLDKLAMFVRLHNWHQNSTTGVWEFWAGTWAGPALFIGFVAWTLFFGYLCAYYVRLGNRAINWVVSLPLCLIAAFFALKLTQFIAFDGQNCWFFSLFLLGFSGILGAVNYLTTVIKLRCPGMTMFRLPLSVWSLFITSVLVVLATPVLAAVLLMNQLDHLRLTSFFEPFNWFPGEIPPAFQDRGSVGGGGYPLLHQHLFWFYSHPAVYIMILPAMGMVSDVMAVFARKPVFGYRPMVYALSGIAFLGFIVWAHHMFQSGMNPTLATTFAVSTIFIAVPSAIKVFNWLGTLWGGNIQFKTPMLNAVSFVACFVIGGLSGIFMASQPIDVHIHDTYFIIAHIHYVLFGGSLFGFFAAITMWYPKMFGRMMNETLGKIHWLLTFVFFNLTFFPMHILGMGGMARRLFDPNFYPGFQHFQPMNTFISISAFCLGLTQVLFAINFIGSWVWGPKAGRNPWLATTLEWETESPPPHGNFHQVPVVHHGPYEYSSPLVEEDWLAQTRWVEGTGQLAAAH